MTDSSSTAVAEKTTADILHEAADIIRQRGLYHDDFQDPNGTGVCAWGACNIAAGGDAYYLVGGYAALLVLSRYTRRTFDQTGVTYSDSHTAEEVIAALEAAAATA